MYSMNGIGLAARTDITYKMGQSTPYWLVSQEIVLNVCR